MSMSTLNSPQVWEEHGRAVAKKLAEINAAAVLCWNERDDVILSHVVGRELGLPVCYANESLGLVELEGALPAHGTVVVVCTDPTRTRHLLGLIGAAKSMLATVVAAVSIADELAHLDPSVVDHLVSVRWPL